MISRSLGWCLVLLVVCGPAAAGQSRGWRASSYKGLRPGKSRAADVKRAFGEPGWVGHPEDEHDNPDENMIAYEYENVGGFEGRTAVWMRKRSGVVTEILLYPASGKPFPLRKALDMFGSGYVERDMNSGPCPAAGQSRRLKRSQDRSYPIFLVYPQKGLYVSVTAGNNVQEIVYAVRCP